MRKIEFMKKIIAAGMLMTMGISLFTGCSAEEEVKDFGAYAKSVEELTIPEEVRIVALGEASHGNKEFQELKLDVFAHLVETTTVRAFAIEGDFGSCALTNDYILYDKGTAEEAVKNLSFNIYKTDEMLELVEWMHDYNQNAKENEKVRLYGFDMQQNEATINRIKDFYHLVDKEKGDAYIERWDTLYGDGETKVSSENLSKLKELMKEITADMEENGGSYTNAVNEELYAYALQASKCVQQHLELHGAVDDMQNYAELRDQYMAENVKWILNREESLYGAKLMIAGHNGHVARDVNSFYVNMGCYLADEMKEEYFVIGTDFYKTNCNIATEDTRKNYKFCSDDPLAKAVGNMEENVYYLDFADAQESEELSTILNNKMKTGSLGESYSPMVKLIKSSYQLNIAPSILYDGMIFVYKATPIEVWED